MAGHVRAGFAQDLQLVIGELRLPTVADDLFARSHEFGIAPLGLLTFEEVAQLAPYGNGADPPAEGPAVKAKTGTMQASR